MIREDEAVGLDVRGRIEAGLSALEQSEGVRILIAVESGSRAWGFPSPDSDYDARFIYLRSLDWYLSIEPGRDVLEQPISDELDISGWDLRKTLELILRSNAVALEWLRSPVVYRDEPELRADLTAFCVEALRRKPLTYHYLRLGTNQYARCITPEGRAKIKKFFYALRPALTLRWLRLREGPPTPPMDIGTLLSEAEPTPEITAFVENLVARKRETRELGEFEPDADLMGFIDQEFAEARRWLEGTAPEPSAKLTVAADTLFRKWVHRFG